MAEDHARTVRIGVLGAARIVRRALVVPARRVPGVTVAALAARDRDRARAHARRLGIPRVHADYDALLADPDLDAVYVPLPNSLHAEWGVRALRAGKHVLCEKPIAGNEAEARWLADEAARAGRVVCEAMHPVYHPLADRVGTLVAEGAIGEVRHVEARISFPIPSRGDIRWSYELGGGALMDLGVYAVALLRAWAGAEPVEVTGAEARIRTPDVDRRVDARLRFANGATGRLVTSMWGWPALASRCHVEGSRGRLTVLNPLGPHLFNRIVLDVDGERSRERVAGRPDTYTCQLRAFVAAVTGGEPPRTGPEHFLASMRVIDAIYRRAGLPPRGVQADAGRGARGLVPPDPDPRVD
ncbi:Gfo/Idh/MocA family oxidoreductase [Streptomyces sp. 8K308]|uniref:Gfo/Idh/MocA family protein n=1 Tax=Streptomyces sp. 8K308 TaxID=2530388 RepID=UPI0010502C93|nr:Gfo/Idh/MocA family oxidoreductase [Streptomyces sp. 8K308]TDC25356.1 Gfo/Idh/MocA family oxidoreductase [Streptomyces sp. 8K308]